MRIEVKGNTKKLEKFLKRMSSKSYLSGLDSIAKEGVRALASNTPMDTGKTAMSWKYTIEEKQGSVVIAWENENIVNGVPIAVILQYGHGTGTGGYVQGRDYINPALRPIFDKLADKAWKEVTK